VPNGVDKRGNGKELEVGAPSPKKQRRVLEAELLEAKVGAPSAFNNICFACKSSGHWARECPFRSPSKPAVQMLVAARATCAEQGGHVARFASVCGGCGSAVLAGADIVVPMRGMGVLVDTVWYHRQCVHNILAVVQAHADEEQHRHTQTPEQATVLGWVQAAEQAHARVQAGPGTGKTQLIVRIYDQLASQAHPITPIVLALNRDAVAVLNFRGVMTAVTFHCYGNRLWRMRHRTAKFRAAKVRDIMRRLYPPTAHQSRKHKYRLDVMGLITHVKKLVSLAKAYALNPECHDFDERLVAVATQHQISSRLQATLRDSECVAKRFHQVLSMAR